MNICLVSTEYPPETGWGGIGSHVYELGCGLAKHGHHVVVVTRAIAEETSYEDKGVIIYRIKPPDIFQKRLLWRINKLWDAYNIAVALKVREIIRKHSIQIIEAPEARGEAFLFGLLCGLGRCGLVVKLHTGTHLTLKLNHISARLKDRLTIFMEKSSVRRADMVVSPSHSLIELNSRRDGYLSKGQKAVVLRNAIDTSRVSTLALADRPFPYSGYILYVGRLETRKGVRTLFDVVAPVIDRFPAIKFIFLGGDCGLRDSFLSGLDDRYKSNVLFLGHVDRDELPMFYHEAAMCVFPSRWENFPYTCLEAMAAGAAVIGGRAGGMAEMIEEDISGMLVSPDSPLELKEKILLLLTNEDLRRALGRNAAKRVRDNFDVEVVVRETIKIYQRLIEERR